MTTSLRQYTTYQKVKDVLANQVNGYFTQAMVEAAINRVEGLIDTRLKMSSSGNITGALTPITWNTNSAPNWVIEGAATYGAALQLCGPSILSWNTLDQLVNAQNTFSYFFKVFMDIIESEEFGDFVATG